jgi:hypothetical protein
MPVAVRGLRDLVAACDAAGKELRRDLNAELRVVAEPVRSDAERMAAAEIRRIGERWSRMRVGVTRRVVYVAPKARGVSSRGLQSRKRRNLAPLLMNRAMQPALDRHEDEIERHVEGFIDRVGNHWER